MLRNHHTPHITTAFPVLNEVLSLNAQEYATIVRNSNVTDILNEVLSLNAQELAVSLALCHFYLCHSSMKS